LLNNDAGQNYAWQQQYGNGTTNTSAGSASDFGIGNTPMCASTATANFFSSFEVTILNYTSTSYYKNLLGRFSTMIGLAVGYAGTFNGTWKNTAAINRIALIGTSSGSWVTNSQIRIYGRN
jgi:hypothetical protein